MAGLAVGSTPSRMTHLGNRVCIAAVDIMLICTGGAPIPGETEFRYLRPDAP